jgi:hypothetical protein
MIPLPKDYDKQHGLKLVTGCMTISSGSARLTYNRTTLFYKPSSCISVNSDQVVINGNAHDKKYCYELGDLEASLQRDSHLAELRLIWPFWCLEENFEELKSKLEQGAAKVVKHHADKLENLGDLADRLSVVLKQNGGEECKSETESKYGEVRYETRRTTH